MGQILSNSAKNKRGKISNQNKAITILSGNSAKIAEFDRLLGTDLDHFEINLLEVQDTDVRKVAEHKAIEGYKKLGRPCFVDDTGLTIHEWGNLPGALIKWFLDNVGVEGIMEMMGGSNDRTATVTTALGYCDEDGVQIFVGEVQGKISNTPRGENGFGYDSIFIPDGFNKTFGEMTDDEKAEISMRSIAARAMKEALDL